MRVWRVEHKETRQGPYTRSSGVESMACERHPMPYSDGLQPVDLDEHRFGFVDVKSLKTWFNEKERKMMVKHGFVCNIYEVPKKHTRHGKKQSVFDPNKAKLIRKSKVLK